MSFFFLKLHPKVVEFVNYFATSICKYVIQIVINTDTLKLFAQVSISKLTQVHNSYLYLLKRKINNFKKLTNLTNQKRKTRLNCVRTQIDTLVNYKWEELPPISPMRCFVSLRNISYHTFALWSPVFAMNFLVNGFTLQFVGEISFVDRCLERNLRSLTDFLYLFIAPNIV